MSNSKIRSQIANQANKNKKIAFEFARKLFGISPSEFDDLENHLSARFHMNVPLYTPTAPCLLRVPLDLYFSRSSHFKNFLVVLPSPFYIDINPDRFFLHRSFPSRNGFRLFTPISSVRATRFPIAA